MPFGALFGVIGIVLSLVITALVVALVLGVLGLTGAVAMAAPFVALVGCASHAAACPLPVRWPEVY